MPLAWPGIMAGSSFLCPFFREFGATLMIAGNIPGRTQTIPLAIYFAVAAGDNDRALAWVAIIMLISMLSILALNYWQRYGKNYANH